MFIVKKIRENLNNTGHCIGVVLSDGKNRVSYSMARNASRLTNMDGVLDLLKSGQLKASDEFDEAIGYGIAVKRLLMKKDWINEFSKANQHKIRPTVVDELKKYIYASKEMRKTMTIPEGFTVAERILAEMLEMQERSNRYFK